MNYVECKLSNCGNKVFAAELCRKHYERERLEKAAPCSFLGCLNKSFRGVLCEKHYRASMLEKKPICIVPGCGDHQKNLTSGFCAKHEFRSRRHGSIEQTRPDDWGSRDNHPLYASWNYHKRLKNGLDPEWFNDFWVFVSAVGERPGNYTLRKLDPKKPLGPNNWLWKDPIDNSDTKKYQQQWRKRNPEKSKHHNLKKQYGIGLEDYEKMAADQGGLCAICKQPEMTIDKDGAPRSMPVDHSHVTGKVRALLCTSCNRGLGFFKDSPGLLIEAAKYLELHLKNNPCS